MSLSDPPDLKPSSAAPSAGASFDEQRRLVEKLRQSEERFRLLVKGVKDYAIFMLLPDGTIDSWNDGAQRAKGYTAEEIIGKNFSIFYTPEDRASGKSQELLRLALAQGQAQEEGWRVRKDGTRFWADILITPVRDEQGRLRGFAKVTRDVTERKMAQQTIEEKQREIASLQKLEAVGRLAGGIAHDFNNLIAGILGCAEELRALAGADGKMAEEVDEIQKACDRASTLTRQLLAFSRRQIAAPTVVDVNAEIQDVEKMLGRLIGAEIRLELQLAPRLPPIKIDVSQFQQIVINLVLNARDAMPGGGRLILRTASVTLDELARTQDFTISPGEYIMLSIADTGTGMSPEVLGHIFEPFFTTKPTGKGTGLGLATVYGIVQQNQGTISVHSDPQVGTTFKIFMPVHSEGPEPRRRPQEALAPDADLRGTETILIAEDDALVLRNTVRSLQSRGYTVLSATDGAAAIALIEKVKGKIQLLITDVIMPKMNGKELAETLQRSLPGVPVIFMSGFSADLIAERGILKQDVAFLEKPFNALVLAQKVRTVLDSRKA